MTLASVTAKCNYSSGASNPRLFGEKLCNNLLSAPDDPERTLFADDYAEREREREQSRYGVLMRLRWRRPHFGAVGRRCSQIHTRRSISLVMVGPRENPKLHDAAVATSARGARLNWQLRWAHTHTHSGGENNIAPRREVIDFDPDSPSSPTLTLGGWRHSVVCVYIARSA